LIQTRQSKSISPSPGRSATGTASRVFSTCDLVYLHPEAASADAIALVQTLEAKVIAEKAAREKRLAEGRERKAAWREVDRVKH
jgi:hypothetical protein